MKPAHNLGEEAFMFHGDHLQAKYGSMSTRTWFAWQCIVPNMGKKLTAAEVVAANLNRLMADGSLSNKALEARTAKRVTSSTIGRMRRAENDPGVLNVEIVAKAFGLEAWQFLIPNVSPLAPPSVDSGVSVWPFRTVSVAAIELLSPEQLDSVEVAVTTALTFLDSAKANKSRAA